jgi:3-hydroxyacyl-CoA dehydrogenase
MTEQQVGPIEVGVFDLSRLPVMWGDVDPDKAEQAVATIEASVEEQVKQLESKQKKQRQE